MIVMTYSRKLEEKIPGADYFNNNAMLYQVQLRGEGMESSINIQMNRCQMDNRREIPLIKGIMLLVRMVIPAVVLLCIRDICDQLEEIQSELETIRIQSDGMIQTSTGAPPPKEADDKLHYR